MTRRKELNERHWYLQELMWLKHICLISLHTMMSKKAKEHLEEDIELLQLEIWEIEKNVLFG